MKRMNEWAQYRLKEFPDAFFETVKINLIVENKSPTAALFTNANLHYNNMYLFIYFSTCNQTCKLGNIGHFSANFLFFIAFLSLLLSLIRSLFIRPLLAFDQKRAIEIVSNIECLWIDFGEIN